MTASDYDSQRLSRLLTPTEYDLGKLNWDLSKTNVISRVDWPDDEHSSDYIINEPVRLALRLPDGIRFDEDVRQVICMRAEDDTWKVAEDTANELERIFVWLPPKSREEGRALAIKYITAWNLTRGGTTEAAIDQMKDWFDQEPPYNSYMTGRRDNYPIIELAIDMAGPDMCSITFWFFVGEQPISHVIVAAFRAIELGDAASVTKALDEGLDPNTANIQGDLLLHQAAVYGRRDIIEELLRRGADVNAPGNLGVPPLQRAVLRGQLQEAELLLEHGADINGTGTSNKRATVLHQVSEYFTDNSSGFPNDQLARWLLERGADLHATDRVGDTPLHKAARKGHYKVAEVLEAYGAKWDVKNTKGHTPLDYRRQFEERERKRRK